MRISIQNVWETTKSTLESHKSQIACGVLIGAGLSVFAVYVLMAGGVGPFDGVSHLSDQIQIEKLVSGVDIIEQAATPSQIACLCSGIALTTIGSIGLGIGLILQKRDGKAITGQQIRKLVTGALLGASVGLISLVAIYAIGVNGPFGSAPQFDHIYLADRSLLTAGFLEGAAQSRLILLSTSLGLAAIAGSIGLTNHLLEKQKEKNNESQSTSIDRDQPSHEVLINQGNHKKTALVNLLKKGQEILGSNKGKLACGLLIGAGLGILTVVVLSASGVDLLNGVPTNLGQLGLEEFFASPESFVTMPDPSFFQLETAFNAFQNSADVANLAYLISGLSLITLGVGGMALSFLASKRQEERVVSPDAVKKVVGGIALGVGVGLITLFALSAIGVGPFGNAPDLASLNFSKWAVKDFNQMTSEFVGKAELARLALLCSALGMMGAHMLVKKNLFGRIQKKTARLLSDPNDLDG